MASSRNNGKSGGKSAGRKTGILCESEKDGEAGKVSPSFSCIPANFLRHYPRYKNGAFNLTELARLCDISRTTAYKHIGLLEG